MARASEPIEPTAESFFEGEHIPDDDKVLSPETRLARAVLWRAYDDAFLASDYLLRLDRSHDDPDTIRASARRFLTLNHSKWLEDREYWCDLADLPEPTLRRACLERLPGAKVADAEARKAKIEAMDKAFEALLSEPEDTILNRKLTALARREAELV